MRRDDRPFAFEWRRPAREDYGATGLLVRFVVSLAALWLAQALIPGFDIEGAGALIFGALIFGAVNAVIRPVVAFVSCLFTVLTLGLFILIINTLMLALTAWIAGWFDLAFEVDGFFAAFFGALIVSVVSTLLNAWTDRNVLRPMRRPW
jgi:putative membrane protein